MAKILSSNPNAIALLEEKIADLEAQRTSNNAVNKLVRNNDKEGLKELGLSEERILALFCNDSGTPGIQSKVNKNLEYKIKAAKNRIVKIKIQKGISEPSSIAEKEASEHIDTFKKIESGEIKNPLELGESIEKDHIKKEDFKTDIIEKGTPLLSTVQLENIINAISQSPIDIAIKENLKPEMDNDTKKAKSIARLRLRKRKLELEAEQDAKTSIGKFEDLPIELENELSSFSLKAKEKYIGGSDKTDRNNMPATFNKTWRSYKKAWAALANAWNDEMTMSAANKVLRANGVNMRSYSRMD